MAGVNIKIDSTDKILLKRNLQNDGKAQKYFTHMVRTLSDPYVPFDNGDLKRTARESTHSITYVQPYAHKQFEKNAGNGTQGTKNGGLRGKNWTNRMWADRGKEIVKAVADYVGGKEK